MEVSASGITPRERRARVPRPGDGTFQPGQSYAVGAANSRPNSVVVGDFNGDGIHDLAVAHIAGVSILLGEGDGTFQVSAYAIASGAHSVTTGEFNKDGILDLALADTSGVRILPGNGDGTFQAAPSYAAGPGGQIAVADLNNDGFPDLVLASYNPGVLTILLNAP